MINNHLRLARTRARRNNASSTNSRRLSSHRVFPSAKSHTKVRVQSPACANVDSSAIRHVHGSLEINSPRSPRSENGGTESESDGLELEFDMSSFAKMGDGESSESIESSESSESIDSSNQHADRTSRAQASEGASEEQRQCDRDSMQARISTELHGVVPAPCSDELLLLMTPDEQRRFHWHRQQTIRRAWTTPESRSPSARTADATNAISSPAVHPELQLKSHPEPAQGIDYTEVQRLFARGGHQFLNHASPASPASLEESTASTTSSVDCADSPSRKSLLDRLVRDRLASYSKGVRGVDAEAEAERAGTGEESSDDIDDTETQSKTGSAQIDSAAWIRRMIEAAKCIITDTQGSQDVTASSLRSSLHDMVDTLVSNVDAIVKEDRADAAHEAAAMAMHTDHAYRIRQAVCAWGEADQDYREQLASNTAPPGLIEFSGRRARRALETRDKATRAKREAMELARQHAVMQFIGHSLPQMRAERLREEQRLARRRRREQREREMVVAAQHSIVLLAEYFARNV